MAHVLDARPLCRNVPRSVFLLMIAISFHANCYVYIMHSFWNVSQTKAALSSPDLPARKERLQERVEPWRFNTAVTGSSGNSASWLTSPSREDVTVTSLLLLQAEFVELVWGCSSRLLLVRCADPSGSCSARLSLQQKSDIIFSASETIFTKENTETTVKVSNGFFNNLIKKYVLSKCVVLQHL